MPPGRELPWLYVPAENLLFSAIPRRQKMRLTPAEAATAELVRDILAEKPLPAAPAVWIYPADRRLEAAHVDAAWLDRRGVDYVTIAASTHS
jgi:hypothetical protein